MLGKRPKDMHQTHTDTPGTYHDDLPATVLHVHRGASELHFNVVLDVGRDNVDLPVLVMVWNVRPAPPLDCGLRQGRPWAARGRRHVHLRAAAACASHFCCCRGCALTLLVA
jgi:hypothetical protein